MYYLDMDTSEEIAEHINEMHNVEGKSFADVCRYLTRGGLLLTTREMRYALWKVFGVRLRFRILGR